MFSELQDDVVGRVFGEWIAFTENEDCRGSMVIWEFDAQAKIAEVPIGDTAYPVRKPHYYVAITGACVQWSTQLYVFTHALIGTLFQSQTPLLENG